MKQKPRSRRRHRSTESVLRLPDLEHAKAEGRCSYRRSDEGYCTLRRNQRPRALFSLAVDKSGGYVKDKDVPVGVCDTACWSEKAEDKDSGISR
jgi:hypothetical protein